MITEIKSIKQLATVTATGINFFSICPELVKCDNTYSLVYLSQTERKEGITSSRRNMVFNEDVLQYEPDYLVHWDSLDSLMRSIPASLDTWRKYNADTLEENMGEYTEEFLQDFQIGLLDYLQLASKVIQERKTTNYLDHINCLEWIIQSHINEIMDRGEIPTIKVLKDEAANLMKPEELRLLSDARLKELILSVVNYRITH